MTLLSETAHVLTHTHKRHTATEDGDVWGDEESLLGILAGCVGSDMGRGSASGVASTGSPIDLGALDLWNEITRIIDTCWPGNGDPAYVRVPTTIKLNAWVVHTTDPVAEAALLDLCRQWVARIREIIEPTKKVPMRGMMCPHCKCTHVEQEQDGDITFNTAMIAHPDAQPMRIECRVCESSWEGRQLHDLQAVVGVLVE